MTSTSDKSVDAPTYSFFDNYHYIWTPQRPERSAEELAALEAEVAAVRADAAAVILSFEDRVAIRSLLYTVIDDYNLRSIIDSILLPPPYAAKDLHDKRWTSADVAAVCSVLSPSLDLLVISLPFNLALRLGAYDARLRAAGRRLSWILHLPFSLVEQKESALAQLHTTAVGTVTDTTADAAKQAEVRRSREDKKRSLKRIATIGGFAVLGGAALVITGGLAAPVVGPAYAALVTATATTIGAIGAVGGAVLGTGALAAAFAAVVGVATHAAALAAVVTPALTAVNLTAIFGAAGVSLSGYKAMRRTADSDVFMLRPIDEVESFSAAAGAGQKSSDEGPEGDAEVVRQLVKSGQAAGFTGAGFDLSAVVEEDSKPGVVVPSHTRTVALSHAASISTVRKRRRRVVFGVENALGGYELRLKALKVVTGIWALTPPSTIPAGEVGICACVNRYAHPTGAGFILCYHAVPVRPSTTAGLLRVWVRAECDFFGSWSLCAACEKAEQEFNPSAAEYWMDEHLSSTSITRRQQGIALELNVSPYTYLKVYPAAVEKKGKGREATFPSAELPQRQMDYAHAVQQRRRIGVSFVNRSSHQVHTCDFGLVNGEQWTETASPMVVNPGEASLTYFTNTGWSLEGAEGYYTIALTNNYADPITPRYYVRLQFEVSSMNRVNIAFASAYNASELRALILMPDAPSSQQFSVELPAGLFFSLMCVTDPEQFTLQLIVQDSVERSAMNGQSTGEQTTLMIGVSGYSAIFDPRRPSRDQQVGLWQGVLRRSEMTGGAEAYALQWEDEFLLRFGEAVHANLDVADRVTQKAVGKVTATAKKTILRGALFTGMHAFASFLAAFQLPLYAVWATGVIDNNFATLSNRSSYAGKDLAAALLDARRGNRPVTLIGFSFGARVIVECLRELEKVGGFGIVEDVYLLGATCSSDPELWRILRRVVAGRLINVYTREDWMLWMLYRANKTDLKPMAGINPVNVPGVENLDVTPLVAGHGDYAAQLLPVLAAVPPAPTQETWSPQQHFGSPGVTVPLKKSEATVKAVRKSLHSYLTSTPYLAMAVKNGLATDLTGYVPRMELLTVQLFGCFFDYMPPSFTETGTVAVSGLLGEGEADMGAVVAYRLPLPPASTRDLLVLLVLCSSEDGQVHVCLQPNLVERRASATESTAEAYARLCTIASETCHGLEDVRRMCVVHGSEWSATNTTIISKTIPISIPDTFTDAHRAACVQLSLERPDPHAAVIGCWGLFTAGSTQLQQQSFTEPQFKTLSSKLRGGSTSAEQMGGKALPAVAEVNSNDHLQSRLRAVAAELQKQQNTTHRTTAFVLVNCGSTPLYFSEDADKRTSVSVAAAAAYGGVMAPQWATFPPPELPANAFAVPLLSSENSRSLDTLDAPSLPALRYETNQGDCAFEVDAAAVLRVDSGGAEGVDAAYTRCCTAVEGRPSLGTVSATFSSVHGTGFVLVMLTPPVKEETAVTSADTVEERMQKYGWYVV